MRRLLLYLPVLLVGFCLGVWAAVKMFAVDVDLLALPYRDQGVRLTAPLEVEQDGLRLVLPLGAEIKLVQQTELSELYVVEIWSSFGPLSAEQLSRSPRMFSVPNK